MDWGISKYLDIILMDRWLLKIALVLLGLYTAYRLGLRAYFEQKEHELARERYLHKGIDILSQNIENALSIFRHNWSHGLTVLKQFRDLGQHMNMELLEQGFMDLDLESLSIAPNYRVGNLINDLIFWKLQQYLYTFVNDSISFIRYEFCAAIRVTLEEGKADSSRHELLNSYMEKFEEINHESQRYYLVLRELENLSSIIQVERLPFRQLARFGKRKAVVRSIKRLKRAFDDKLRSVDTLNS